MRPWRLTRRERVAMEHDLTVIRSAIRRTVVAREGWVSMPEADGLAGARLMVPMSRDMRIVRARTAIALRAALRADEDARCEEALASAGYGEETGATPGDGWDTGYDEGAEAVAHRLREWPVLDRGWWDRVPLALWERT